MAFSEKGFCALNNKFKIGISKTVLLYYSLHNKLGCGTRLSNENAECLSMWLIFYLLQIHLIRI